MMTIEQENRVAAYTVGQMFVDNYKKNLSNRYLVPTKEELETQVIRYVFDNAGFITVGQVEMMIRYVESMITTSMIVQKCR